LGNARKHKDLQKLAEMVSTFSPASVGTDLAQGAPNEADL
jgi:hypothetical protein